MKKPNLLILISILCGLGCISVKSNQSREALTIGGFEGGAGSWSFGYYPEGATTSSGPFQGVNAYDGQWYAYLGDETSTASSANGYMYQYLYPRPETSALSVDVSFYLNVTSQDTSTSAHDTLSVILRVFDDNLDFLYDVQLVSFSNKDREPSGNAKNHHLKTTSYDLTQGVAGHWVTLLFIGKTDSTLATTFRVDDVSAKINTPDPHYTITPSAETGGTISPSSVQTVITNGSVTFTASPSATFTVDKWYVNGSAFQNGGNSFTLNGIKTNETVLVTFKAIFYKVNVQVFGLGTYAINPPGGSYAVGTPITITPSPQTGNQFSEWKGSQYSRNIVLSFAKGGADENLELHFIPTVISSAMNLTVAGSTPATININLPTPTSWLTMCEVCNDMSVPFWQLAGVVDGQNPISTFYIQKIAGTNEYMRTGYVPQVTTPPFLKFPIHTGYTPWTAPVTAVMDHSMTHFEVNKNYDKDANIRTAQGNSFPVLPINQVKGKDFAILSSGVSASTIFNYVGVSEQGGPGYLQYDGHPGYDYGFGLYTDVYAAADGIIMTDDDLAGSNLEGTGMASYYMKNYHALIVEHTQGYCTIYMHLSSIDAAYVDTTDPNNWKPVKTSIGAGSHIGQTGDFDAISHISAHFHFEVWRLDGSTWNYADPYGYSGPAIPSGIQSITPNLWLGN